MTGESAIKVQVGVHGMLQAAVREPEALLEVELTSGADVAALYEALAETSPLFDARSCLTVIDGQRVQLDHTLEDGDRVDLYHTFSGG